MASPSVGFLEAGKLYFQKAFDFKSRSRRSEYWLGYLFVILVSFVGGLVVGLLGGLLGDVGAVLAGIVSFGWSIYSGIASTAMCVRRLHDTGRSGWWYLLGLVPFGGIVLLVWYCTDSTENNQWGPYPKLAGPAGIPAPAAAAPVQARPMSAPVQYPGAAKPTAVPVSREYEPAAVPVRVMPAQTEAGQTQATVCTPTVSTRSPGAVPVMEAVPAVYGILYLYSGPMAGKSFRFPEGRTVVIGRSNTRCDVALPQYNVVSGVHCRITFCKGYINITDLNSTNGTFVNGIRLTPNQTAAAKNGSTIYLANNTCAFQLRFEEV